MLKVGDKVQTKHGPGVIVKLETVSDFHPRFGVKHDVKAKGFSDEILYYFKNEIKLCQK